MGGRGMVEELFFHRVFVEPGDGAQPPGDRSAGPTPGFEFNGEAFDAGAADHEQRQGACTVPGSELAQVQRVGFPGQASSDRPAIPARNGPFSGRPRLPISEPEPSVLRATLVAHKEPLDVPIGGSSATAAISDDHGKRLALRSVSEPPCRFGASDSVYGPGGEEGADL